jgi:PAP2 superfamily protein
LPRGWTDFGRQLAIWFGFYLSYLGARSLADRNPATAFWNGWRVLSFEQRTTHNLVEVTAQQVANSSHALLTAAAWTYWNSEFTVVGLALLWVYLRHNARFTQFRNTILLANVIGLAGYVLLPTAPPRMFPDLGFADTLGDFGGLNHGSGLVQLAANPYAAMPSLHSADALIVGLVLSSICRNRIFKVAWLLWPLWVWFAVMGTGNHFWLDCLAGVLVAVIALAIVYRPGWFRLRRRQQSPVTA